MTTVRPGARGGRDARRAFKSERAAERLNADGVLRSVDDIRADIEAELDTCPFCERQLTPENWAAHMEREHAEEYNPARHQHRLMKPARARANSTLLPVHRIRTDGGTQSRAEIDEEVVAEYSAAMQEAAAFQPIVVYFDGQDYWLADGFHRVEATRMLGRSQISAEVRQGTRRDAVLFSVGANATHGLRRSNSDKQRAVQMMLDDAEWSNWSDREIARLTNTSPTFVGRLRRSLTVNVDSESERAYIDKHGKQATMKVRKAHVDALRQFPEPLQPAIQVIAQAQAESTGAAFTPGLIERVGDVITTAAVTGAVDVEGESTPLTAALGREAEEAAARQRMHIQENSKRQVVFRGSDVDEAISYLLKHGGKPLMVVIYGE